MFVFQGVMLLVFGGRDQNYRFLDVAVPILGQNYGLNRVRFTAPVPVGTRVRGRFSVESVEEVSGGKQATMAVVVEREHESKPACVAEWLVRFYD